LAEGGLAVVLVGNDEAEACAYDSEASSLEKNGVYGVGEFDEERGVT
jgi:hypothetical protein